MANDQQKNQSGKDSQSDRPSQAEGERNSSTTPDTSRSGSGSERSGSDREASSGKTDDANQKTGSEKTGGDRAENDRNMSDSGSSKPQTRSNH